MVDPDHELRGEGVEFCFACPVGFSSFYFFFFAQNERGEEGVRVGVGET